MPYIGSKMSINAAAAYDAGEKPWSKWTKDELFCALSLDGERRALLQKLTAEELRCELLTYAGWHHTGAFFAETNFWLADQDKADKLDAKAVAEIIAYRRSRRKKPQKKEDPAYIAALVDYTFWTSSQKHRTAHKVSKEYVRFRSDAKTVQTKNGRKRLASLFFEAKIRQKTRFASEKKLLQEYRKRVIQEQRVFGGHF